MARKHEEWLAYAVVGGIIYWILTRPKAPVAQPPASGPVVTNSGTGQPLQLVAGNPNNLVSVATPDETAQIAQDMQDIVGGGGAEF